MPKDKKDTQLHIRLPEWELEQIQRNAQACDMTVSAYVRLMARDMCILKTDHRAIIDHTKSISSIKNAIIQLCFTMIKTERYMPLDFEWILERLDELTASESKFLNLMNKTVDSNKRLLARTVRRRVNEVIKPRR